MKYFLFVSNVPLGTFEKNLLNLMIADQSPRVTGALGFHTIPPGSCAFWGSFQ